MKTSACSIPLLWDDAKQEVHRSQAPAEARENLAACRADTTVARGGFGSDFAVVTTGTRSAGGLELPKDERVFGSSGTFHVDLIARLGFVVATYRWRRG